MNRYRLCAGVTYRCFPDCAIVLDIGRDRYWRVGCAAAQALDKIGEGSDTALDPGQLAWLSAMQLVEPDDDAFSVALPSLPLAACSAAEIGPWRYDGRDR